MPVTIPKATELQLHFKQQNHQLIDNITTSIVKQLTQGVNPVRYSAANTKEQDVIRKGGIVEAFREAGYVVRISESDDQRENYFYLNVEVPSDSTH
jgi:hypothetical protein